MSRNKALFLVVGSSWEAVLKIWVRISNGTRSRVLHRTQVIHELHLDSAFLTSGHSKRFTKLHNIHPFMHTPTTVSAMQCNSQLVRSSLGEVARSGTRTSTC